MDISIRSTELELMDQKDLDKKSLRMALGDINLCNRWLGGRVITLKAVKKIIKKHPQKSYTIYDVGCGDGEMLRNLHKILVKRKIRHQLIGVDINPTILEIAREKSNGFKDILYQNTNVMEMENACCDILLCTLTLHHLKQEALKSFLEQFVRMSRIAVVINDLERSALSHFLFKIFGVLFLQTKIARNDGLISIRRGFLRKELLSLARQLPHATHQISWQWAFRYLWTINPKT